MSGAYIYEDPSRSISFQKTTTQLFESDIILVVSEKENDTELKSDLTFMLIYKDGTASDDWHSSITSENKGKLKKNLENKLKKIASISDEYNNDRLANLEGYLQNLFDKIIPNELGNIIKGWESGKIICITTNEQWIPWELLHDRIGYLGQRFLIFRLPRITKNNSRREQNINKISSKKKLTHIVGGGIDDCFIKKARDGIQVIKKEGIEVEEIEKIRLEDLAKISKDSLILHFTCHGHVDPCYIQLNEYTDPDINLTIDYLKSSKFELRNDCFIFANACSSSDASPILGEFSNFGAEFYKKGSNFFIGTLGKIPTQFAVDFAYEFYNNLSILKCVHSAFIETKKSMTQGEKIFGILYIIYGNPKDVWKIDN